MTERLFTATDIGKILGIDSVQLYFYAKQHSIVEPAVRGKRDKYTARQLVELAVADHLHRCGINYKIIRGFLDKERPHLMTAGTLTILDDHKNQFVRIGISLTRIRRQVFENILELNSESH